MSRTRSRAYGDDVSYIHDAGHGDFARDAAPGLLEILHAHGIAGGLVVDLGCGSGLWAQALDRAGHDVLGIDYSRAMLRIARKRVPAARFRQGSFQDVPLPPCRAVTALSEVLNYRFDANPKLGPRTLEQVARRVFAALEPGGLFVFDVVGPGCAGRTGSYERHRMGDDWAILVRVEEHRTRRQLTRDMTSFRKVGRHYRRDREVHQLQLYRKSDVARTLRRIGFRVRHLQSYGGIPFATAHGGFLARKP